MDTVLEEEGTSKTVYFTVEGKFLADLARTRVEEGAWDSGLRILTDSLEGLTHEQAVALLRGRADLTGWSSDAEGIGYKTLSDTGPLAKRMDARLQWLYGTVFKYRDAYWKPYARVESWGQEDYYFSRLRQGRRNVVDGTVRSRSLRHNPDNDFRSLFYAEDPQADLLVCVQLDHIEQAEVLCKRVDMPPLWFQVPVNSPAEHVLAKLKAGLKLEVRGAYLDEPRLTHTPQTKAEEDLDSELEQAAEPSATQEVADESPATDEQQVIDGAIARVRAFKAATALVSEFTERLAQAATREEIRTVEREFDAAFEALEHPDAKDEFSEARYRLEDEMHARRLQALGAEVARQADEKGGWLEIALTLSDGSAYAPRPTLRVPKHPFLLWALRGFNFEANGKERPEWALVSSSGMKMVMDDAFHTDWMLGAGVNIDNTYSNEDDSFEAVVRRSSSSVRADLVEEWTQAQFVVLARGTHRRFHGAVAMPEPNKGVEPGSIAVVPTAGPEYQLAMTTACKPGQFGSPGLIICDTGGKLAHLALVAREYACTVLMVPDATKRFREGQLLLIDMETGTLSSSIL